MTSLDALIRHYINTLELEGDTDPDDTLIAAARQEHAELVAAVREVETWWLTIGMAGPFDGRLGAPACFWTVREVLARLTPPHGQEAEAAKG